MAIYPNRHMPVSTISSANRDSLYGTKVGTIVFIFLDKFHWWKEKRDLYTTKSIIKALYQNHELPRMRKAWLFSFCFLFQTRPCPLRGAECERTGASSGGHRCGSPARRGTLLRALFSSVYIHPSSFCWGHMMWHPVEWIGREGEGDRGMTEPHFHFLFTVYLSVDFSVKFLTWRDWLNVKCLVVTRLDVTAWHCSVYFVCDH